MQASQRTRPRFPSWPSAPLIALATSGAAWPAAGYGALVIWAAGDFAATGTLWIFRWPFLLQLLAATGLHLLAVGAGVRWGIPALLPGLQALDRALARPADVATGEEAPLRAALHGIVRFPLWNQMIGVALAALVMAASMTLEGLAASSTSPNIQVILRGGLYATALYGTASLALGELLTRPACRALRRAAVAAGLEPYDGFALARGWRVAAMVVPTLVPLLVSVDIGISSHRSTLAYTVLIALSALVAVALNWLQYENARSAVRELRDACRDLAEGHDGGLVTGSIEPLLLDMATEFTAAARRVVAHRRDSGERYRAVFEAALDCIITMDHEGRILEFNPAAERTFGYVREAILGTRWVDAIVPPASRAMHLANVARYLERGEPGFLGQRVELSAMRADGSEFPAEIAVTRIQRDGPAIFTAHLRDITERKRAEEALTASKREIEEQAEIATALLHVGETINAHLNQPDMLAQVSHLTVEAVGCDAGSILVHDKGRQALVLAANAGSRPEIVSEIEQVAFTPESFAVLRPLQPGQLLEVPDVAHSSFPAGLAERWRIASLLAAPISRGGEIVGVIVATYRDRTGPFTPRQRRLALGIAHATAGALENARLIADLQAASRLKTEFVSTMSHELRTPLNVILGFCEMARDVAASARERDLYHARIEMAGRTLLDLVESTLEVGKLEAGREELQLEPVELVAFWEKLGREYAVLPRHREVVLEWSPRAPEIVLLADPRKLAMVIRNLVGNALKFTEQGFVRAEAALEDGSVVLRVSDSGIGIEPKDQDAVFEMFCQGDGSDSRRHGGTGLGLYIVRRFVQQLGGTIALDSAPGRGSVFTVRLPFPGAPGREAPRPDVAPSEQVLQRAKLRAGG